MLELEKQGQRMTELLQGLTITLCHRHKPNEVVIEFSNGTRLFIDSPETIEVSITGIGDD